VAIPDPTENSPKSCLAFSAAERADVNPAEDALTQIPAVRRPAIITSAIWACDRRAVTYASEQRKFVLWSDVIKHGRNPLRLSVALKIGSLNGSARVAEPSSLDGRSRARRGRTGAIEHGHHRHQARQRGEYRIDWPLAWGPLARFCPKRAALSQWGSNYP